MKLGQYVQVAVTAVNPDGSQAQIPAGTLVVSSDNTNCAAQLTGDTSAKVSAAAVGNSVVTFSCPGFKPVSLPFVITDLPQLVATPGPEQQV